MICDMCDGKGTVMRESMKVNGKLLGGTRITCFKCDGTGEICDCCGESQVVCAGSCQDDDKE